MAEEFKLNDYYYNQLKSNEERTYFRMLLNKKIGVNANAFYQWLNRGEAPGYAEIIIADIIADPAFKLPPVKPVVESVK